MNNLKLRVWDDVLQEMLYSKVEQFDDAILFRFSKHLETENPRLKDATCSTCEHLNDEYFCVIKDINKNPDTKCCEKYENCGYDMAADPYFF